MQLLDPKLICEFSYHVHLPSCVIWVKKISTKQERAVVQAMRHLVADLWSTQAILVTRGPLEFSIVLVSRRRKLQKTVLNPSVSG